MIFGMVSCFREGRLALGAIESAARGCETVLVAEGAVGPNLPEGDETDFRKLPRNAIVKRGAWEDEAAKRTFMVEWARELANRKLQGGIAWLLWVDGDEVLLWPEYLPDLVARAEHENGAGGFGLRIVELDGSVAMCSGKIVKLAAVSRYLVSTSQAQLTNGMVVALPNVPICHSGGIPIGDWSPEMPEADRNEWLSKHRPPLQGEPHLLHRSMLRPPTRTAARLHEAEGNWFDDRLVESGLGRLVLPNADGGFS